jgi:hypothetical protein
MHMRNRLLVPSVAAAGLFIAITAVTAAAASPPQNKARPGAPAALAPATGGTVVLINGDRVVAGPGTGRRSVTVLPPGSGLGGSLLTLGAGGVTYKIPVAAVPFLGRGLDPSLFNVGGMLRRERGGRVPVRVAYRGHRPALPGVTLTRARGGVATGYLTASSARLFGAALARQFAADHARGSYGRDGMFAGGVSVSLAGTAPARGSGAVSLALATRPRFVMHTLTVTGTNLAGAPDTGGFVMVVNVDDSRRFFDGATFDHGTVKLSVPAGHYWAAGIFTDAAPKGRPAAQRMVVLPQFTVSRDATVGVGERTATSKIAVSTPRPSRTLDTNVNVLRPGAAGPASYADISGQGNAPLYVSPTTRRPTVGRLETVSSWIRLFPPGAKGVPYQYYLDHLETSGLLSGNQHYVVRPGTLATVHARFYSDIPGTGIAFFIGVPSAVANEPMSFDVTGNRVRLPGRQTQYFTAGSPPVVWQEWEQSLDSADGQIGPFREFRPGAQVTEPWGAFPLHPAPNVNLVGAVAGDLAPSLISASRSGDTLTLDLAPFSDGIGDTGTRFTGLNGPGSRLTGRYEIDEDGKTIASGNAVGTGVIFGDFHTTATLGPKPSVIRFTLGASITGADYPLSPATHTVWTWRSTHEAGATVPRGWACRWVSTAPHLRGRDCVAEPMMTLGYRVAGLGLDGSAAAGRQTVGISVGHLQLAAAAGITAAAVQVSLDGGKTWHAATVTGSRGTYRAVFTAPAGAYVTLRVTAADAAGGRIAETITRAYKIAS